MRGLRPHAAGRAARWFLDNFPGDVAYAYKANNSVFLIGALYGAGIRHFDVASLPEIEDAATIPDAHLHFMHPVKSRHAIRRAYELGVRSFALDGEDELEKILAATDGARDLLLWVRIAVPAINSRIPLERKFGLSGPKAAKLLVKTRQAAAELGNLARKLLIYATGADIQFADREVVEQLVAKSRAQNYGFRSLVHEVVQTRVFLNK